DAEFQEQFSGRKKAIEKSLENLKKHADRSVRFKEANEIYIKNYETAVGLLKDVNSPQDLWDKLNRGSKALYNTARNFFDRTVPEAKVNAEVSNNTMFDMDWQGTYFPRSYNATTRNIRTSDSQQTYLELIADGNIFGGDNIRRDGEASGAKNNRTLSGSELPVNTYINLDFMDSFLQQSGAMLFDIETQASRQYLARAMGDPRVLEIFGDVAPLSILRNAAVQKLDRDLQFTGD